MYQIKVPGPEKGAKNQLWPSSVLTGILTKVSGTRYVLKLTGGTPNADMSVEVWLAQNSTGYQGMFFSQERGEDDNLEA